MDEDHTDSSIEEGSAYDFVRRSMAKERIERTLSRKALVESLVGRVIKPEVRLRPRSVVMARKSRRPSAANAASADEFALLSSETPEAALIVAKQSGDAVVSTEPEKSDLNPLSNLTRTTSEQKLRMFASVVGKIGAPRRLTAGSLIRRVAAELNTTYESVNTFWKKGMTREQKDFLLYGIMET